MGYRKSTFLALVAATLSTSVALAQTGPRSAAPLSNPPAPVWVDDAVPLVAQASTAARGNSLYEPSGYGVMQTSHSDCVDGGAGCADGCFTKSCCDDCCIPFWEHRTMGFGEFLYLQPRGIDVAYALPRDGINPILSVPFGAVGVADPDYEPGFRAGFGFALDRCSSVGVAYSHFESSTVDSISTNAPLVIHSLLTLPGTASAAADSLVATAAHDIDFELIDVDYRRLISGGENYAINYTVGARWAHLDQNFQSTQPISPGTTSVTTDIDFEGIGARFGLDGMRRGYCNGLLIYGKGFANFLAGEFKADYIQTNTFATTQGFTSLEDDRVVSILEYEVGAGWESPSGRVRITGGYYMAAWYDTLSTREYIQAVQTNDYVDRGETLTFDGLVARIELRR